MDQAGSDRKALSHEEQVGISSESPDNDIPVGHFRPHNFDNDHSSTHDHPSDDPGNRGIDNQIDSRSHLHRAIRAPSRAQMIRVTDIALPTPESAIQKLEKKKLDRQMIGDCEKKECIICLEEVYLGGEVTVLRCKHWFHHECVMPWLRNHNTCPLCRAPTEQNGNEDEDNGNGYQSNNQQQRQLPRARTTSMRALFGTELLLSMSGLGSSTNPGFQHNTRVV